MVEREEEFQNNLINESRLTSCWKVLCRFQLKDGYGSFDHEMNSFGASKVIDLEEFHFSK